MASVRVVAWSWVQARRLARSLPTGGMDAIDMIGPAPEVAARHRTTVTGVLRLTRSTCLVRSAVLQRWDADHGVPRVLVIGVSRGGPSGVAAHAWLEGEPHAQFEELHRRPPPVAGGGPDAARALS